MADKGSARRVINEELQRFWPKSELKKRESRSRGYAAGYESEPLSKTDGTEEWKQGWTDAQRSIGK